jgi:hypothetical protein
MPGGHLSGRDLTGFGILTAGLEIGGHRGLEDVNVTEDTGFLSFTFQRLRKSAGSL